MKHTIPQFALYGEGRWIDNPDFVHIEDIAARSSDLGWHIKAHQHTQLLQILLLKSGSVQLQMDADKRFLEGRWGIIIPPGTVHGFRFAPQTDGRVLSISDSLLGSDYASSAFIRAPDCINLNGEQEDFQHLWQLLNLLEYEFHHINSHKNELIEHLLKSILVYIERHHASVSAQPQSHDDLTLQRLKGLVNNHLREHWKLCDYASALNVSDKKLNRLTQQAYGKTVIQLVHEHLLLEAKRHLIYTQKSVEEIAYDLGFKDPGYFSRFFKRCEEMTPGQYRQASEKHK
ncbi:helix-turn-helix domain-containing protein [Marinomonas fungiae]|uniref:AraC-type DNA-binding domain and AraC-containing proteins n=1 Tax=Marinomonas fungiae TaxID=1137284 RepID=A0A0K6ISM1_9GAMM|nr:helix-turn-helix domain-containing protein [Marinomonas fungiae]CUB06337.1 AraC-type DNA-binding domain and AraC-containing proteins [Marinomonas fungiae]